VSFANFAEDERGWEDGNWAAGWPVDWPVDMPDNGPDDRCWSGDRGDWESLEDRPEAPVSGPNQPH
jgi:hypothetical protein